MNTLPNDQKLLEMLAVLQAAQAEAREICDTATAIALKYQHRMQQVRQERQQPADATE